MDSFAVAGIWTQLLLSELFIRQNKVYTEDYIEEQIIQNKGWKSSWFPWALQVARNGAGKLNHRNRELRSPIPIPCDPHPSDLSTRSQLFSIWIYIFMYFDAGMSEEGVESPIRKYAITLSSHSQHFLSWIML